MSIYACACACVCLDVYAAEDRAVQGDEDVEDEENNANNADPSRPLMKVEDRPSVTQGFARLLSCLLVPLINSLSLRVSIIFIGVGALVRSESFGNVHQRSEKSRAVEMKASPPIVWACVTSLFCTRTSVIRMVFLKRVFSKPASANFYALIFALAYQARLVHV
jgi:hypothetical protein